MLSPEGLTLVIASRRITPHRTLVTLPILVVSLSLCLVQVRTRSTPRANATANQPKSSIDRSEPETNPSVLFVENVGQFDSRIRFQAQARNGNFRLVDQGIWVTLFDRVASLPAVSRHTTKVSKATVLTNKQLHEIKRDKKTFILQRRDGERIPAQVKRLSGVNIKLSLPGASFSPWVGSFQLETKFAYFLGNDKDKWRSNVPVWATTSYKNLYAGIDLIMESYQGSVVLRFHKGGRASTAQVKVRVEGPTAAQIIPSRTIKGSTLQLTTTSGVLSVPITGVASTGASIKKVAKSTWDVSLAVLNPVAGGAHHVRTKLSRADPLTRNAVTGHTVESLQVLYSTYLGSVEDDNANGVVMDESGNALVTGWTYSMSFPFPGSPGPFIGAGGRAEAFVVKIDPWGRRLLFATFLGGPSFDAGNGIALDAEGSAIVTGTTYSGNDFPTLGPTWGTGGNSDIFVTKLDPSGMSLDYSVRIGGSQQDTAQRVAVDRGNRVAVVGSSISSDFPTTPGVVGTTINRGLASGDFGSDAVVLKLGEFGSTLLYSTFLGGAAVDRGNDIVMDHAGNAFVTGETYSYDVPTTPANEALPVTDLAFQREGPVGGVLYSPPGAVVANSDAFVAKLTPDGRALIYCSYLGGPGPDRGIGVAITRSGQAVVTGAATQGFPTHDAYSSYSGGVYSPFGDGETPADAFVTVFNESGSDLEYSTFLGGAENDTGWSIDVDATGNVYVTGWTYSTDASSGPFPRTRDPFLTLLRRTFGNGDIFAAKLNPSLSGSPSLLYSTVFGGWGMDLPKDISVNSAGIICIAGYTDSRNYPTRPGDVLRITFIGGSRDGFVTKLDLRR